MGKFLKEALITCLKTELWHAETDVAPKITFPVIFLDKFPQGIKREREMWRDEKKKFTLSCKRINLRSPHFVFFVLLPPLHFSGLTIFFWHEIKTAVFEDDKKKYRTGWNQGDFVNFFCFLYNYPNFFYLINWWQLHRCRTFKQKLFLLRIS